MMPSAIQTTAKNNLRNGGLKNHTAFSISTMPTKEQHSPLTPSAPQTSSYSIKSANSFTTANSTTTGNIQPTSKSNISKKPSKPSSPINHPHQTKNPPWAAPSNGNSGFRRGGEASSPR